MNMCPIDDIIPDSGLLDIHSKRVDAYLHQSQNYNICKWMLKLLPNQDDVCVLANIIDPFNLSMAFQFAPVGGFSVGVSSSPPLEKQGS